MLDSTDELMIIDISEKFLRTPFLRWNHLCISFAMIGWVSHSFLKVSIVRGITDTDKFSMHECCCCYCQDNKTLLFMRSNTIIIMSLLLCNNRCTFRIEAQCCTSERANWLQTIFILADLKWAYSLFNFLRLFSIFLFSSERERTLVSRFKCRKCWKKNYWTHLMR